MSSPTPQIVLQSLTWIVVSATLAACGASGETAKPATDVTVLEGTWQGYAAGQTESEWTLLVGGDRYFLNGPGNWLRGGLRVDEELQRIEILVEECDCGLDGESAEASFELNGDRLTLTGLDPDGPRLGFHFVRLRTPEPGDASGRPASAAGSS